MVCFYFARPDPGQGLVLVVTVPTANHGHTLNSPDSATEQLDLQSGAALSKPQGSTWHSGGRSYRATSLTRRCLLPAQPHHHAINTHEHLLLQQALD